MLVVRWRWLAFVDTNWLLYVGWKLVISWSYLFMYWLLLDSDLGIITQGANQRSNKIPLYLLFSFCSVLFCSVLFCSVLTDYSRCGFWGAAAYRRFYCGRWHRQGNGNKRLWLLSFLWYLPLGVFACVCEWVRLCVLFCYLVITYWHLLCNYDEDMGIGRNTL